MLNLERLSNKIFGKPHRRDHQSIPLQNFVYDDNDDDKDKYDTTDELRINLLPKKRSPASGHVFLKYNSSNANTDSQFEISDSELSSSSLSSNDTSDTEPIQTPEPRPPQSMVNAADTTPSQYRLRTRPLNKNDNLGKQQIPSHSLPSKQNLNYDPENSQGYRQSEQQTQENQQQYQLIQDNSISLRQNVRNTKLNLNQPANIQAILDDLKKRKNKRNLVSDEEQDGEVDQEEEEDIVEQDREESEYDLKDNESQQKKRKSQTSIKPKRSVKKTAQEVLDEFSGTTGVNVEPKAKKTPKPKGKIQKIVDPISKTKNVKNKTKKLQQHRDKLNERLRQLDSQLDYDHSDSELESELDEIKKLNSESFNDETKGYQKILANQQDDGGGGMMIMMFAMFCCCVMIAVLGGAGLYLNNKKNQDNEVNKSSRRSNRKSQKKNQSSKKSNQSGVNQSGFTASEMQLMKAKGKAAKGKGKGKGKMSMGKGEEHWEWDESTGMMTRSQVSEAWRSSAAASSVNRKVKEEEVTADIIDPRDAQCSMDCCCGFICLFCTPIGLCACLPGVRQNKACQSALKYCRANCGGINEKVILCFAMLMGLVWTFICLWLTGIYTPLGLPKCMEVCQPLIKHLPFLKNAMYMGKFHQLEIGNHKVEGLEYNKVTDALKVADGKKVEFQQDDQGYQYIKQDGKWVPLEHKFTKIETGTGSEVSYQYYGKDGDWHHNFIGSGQKNMEISALNVDGKVVYGHISKFYDQAKVELFKSTTNSWKSDPSDSAHYHLATLKQTQTDQPYTLQNPKIYYDDTFGSPGKLVVDCDESTPPCPAVGVDGETGEVTFKIPGDNSIQKYSIDLPDGTAVTKFDYIETKGQAEVFLHNSGQDSNIDLCVGKEQNLKISAQQDNAKIGHFATTPEEIAKRGPGTEIKQLAGPLATTFKWARFEEHDKVGDVVKHDLSDLSKKDDNHDMVISTEAPSSDDSDSDSDSESDKSESKTTVTQPPPSTNPDLDDLQKKYHSQLKKELDAGTHTNPKDHGSDSSGVKVTSHGKHGNDIDVTVDVAKNGKVVGYYDLDHKWHTVSGAKYDPNSGTLYSNKANLGVHIDQNGNYKNADVNIDTINSSKNMSMKFGVKLQYKTNDNQVHAITKIKTVQTGENGEVVKRVDYVPQQQQPGQPLNEDVDVIGHNGKADMTIKSVTKYDTIYGEVDTLKKDLMLRYRNTGDAWNSNGTGFGGAYTKQGAEIHEMDIDDVNKEHYHASSSGNENSEGGNGSDKHHNKESKDNHNDDDD